MTVGLCLKLLLGGQLLDQLQTLCDAAAGVQAQAARNGVVLLGCALVGDVVLGGVQLLGVKCQIQAQRVAANGELGKLDTTGHDRLSIPAGTCADLLVSKQCVLQRVVTLLYVSGRKCDTSHEGLLIIRSDGVGLFLGCVGILVACVLCNVGCIVVGCDELVSVFFVKAFLNSLFVEVLRLLLGCLLGGLSGALGVKLFGFFFLGGSGLLGSWLRRRQWPRGA